MEACEGYILQRLNQALADKEVVLDLWTRPYGRITAWFSVNAHFAKNQMGILQPFVPLWITWSPRRARRIAQLEPTGWFRLPGKRLLCALYVNQLLDQSVQFGADTGQLFSYYHDTLYQLMHAAAVAPVLRRFEKQLLAELGYGIRWDCDHQGHRIQPDHRYDFDCEKGFIPNPRGPYTGRLLQEIASGRFTSTQHLQTARLFLQHAICQYFPPRKKVAAERIDPAQKL